MKKQFNKQQKKSITFLFSCILLVLDSCFLYDIFVECNEKYYAIRSVSDCQEWICTPLNQDAENQDIEDPTKQKSRISRQLQRIKEINGVKGVYTIGHEWSYSEEKPECGLAIYSYDDALFNILQYRISEGRLPQREDEIVLTASAKKAYSMYEKVSLIEDNTIVRKTYTVVGFLTQDYLLTGRDYWESDVMEQYLMLFQSAYEKKSDFTSYGAITLQKKEELDTERGNVVFVQCDSQADLDGVGHSLWRMDQDYFLLQNTKDALRKSPAAFLLDGGNLIREIVFFCGMLFLLIAVFFSEWEKHTIIKKGILLLLIPLIVPLKEECNILFGGSLIVRLHFLWLFGIGLLYLLFFGGFLFLKFLYRHGLTALPDEGN